MKRSLVSIFAIGILLALMLSTFQVSASAPPTLGDNVVATPDAMHSDGAGTYGSNGSAGARTVNDVGTWLFGPGGFSAQMVWTSSYVNGSSTPPLNASIHEVYACAIVRAHQPYWPHGPHAPVSRDCQLGYSFGNPHYNLIPSGPFTVTGYVWQEIGWRLTDKMNWTPALLRGPTLSIIVYSTDISTSDRRLEVDYVGLRYNWSYFTTPPGGNETYQTGPGIGNLTLDVMGTLGLFGFVGMVAIPAAAIWLHKKEGGSSAHAAITALLAWVTCLGLFLAAINY